MNYYFFIISRYALTAICKINAFIAGKIKSSVTFELLRQSLYLRDLMLCKEASYCMKQVVKWQKKAKNCVFAHHEYEQEFKQDK